MDELAEGYLDALSVVRENDLAARVSHIPTIDSIEPFLDLLRPDGSASLSALPSSLQSTPLVSLGGRILALPPSDRQAAVDAFLNFELPASATPMLLELRSAAREGPEALARRESELVAPGGAAFRALGSGRMSVPAAAKVFGISGADAMEALWTRATALAAQDIDDGAMLHEAALRRGLSDAVSLQALSDHIVYGEAANMLDAGWTLPELVARYGIDDYQAIAELMLMAATDFAIRPGADVRHVLRASSLTELGDMLDVEHAALDEAAPALIEQGASIAGAAWFLGVRSRRSVDTFESEYVTTLLAHEQPDRDRLLALDLQVPRNIQRVDAWLARAGQPPLPPPGPRPWPAGPAVVAPDLPIALGTAPASPASSIGGLPRRLVQESVAPFLEAPDLARLRAVDRSLREDVAPMLHAMLDATRRAQEVNDLRQFKALLDSDDPRSIAGLAPGVQIEPLLALARRLDALPPLEAEQAAHALAAFPRPMRHAVLDSLLEAARGGMQALRRREDSLTRDGAAAQAVRAGRPVRVVLHDMVLFTPEAAAALWGHVAQAAYDDVARFDGTTVALAASRRGIVDPRQLANIQMRLAETDAAQRIRDGMPLEEVLARTGIDDFRPAGKLAVEAAATAIAAGAAVALTLQRFNIVRQSALAEVESRVRELQGLRPARDA